jgi:hypothetical protein
MQPATRAATARSKQMEEAADAQRRQSLLSKQRAKVRSGATGY